MKLRTTLAVIAVAAVTAPVAAQSITNPDGTPNPAYEGLYGWFKADGMVMNGKAPAGEGEQITAWLDSSDNGRNLIRTSGDANRRPVFAADGGSGMPAVEFDGDDFIWANQTTEFGTISTARTIFAVVRPDAANGGYVFDSCTSAGRNALFTGQASNPEEWVAYTGTATIGCGGVSVDETVLVSMTLETGAQSIRINGKEVAAATEGLQDLPGMLLGARYTTTNGFDGAISEVMVYAEAVAGDDLEAITSYLSDKYGLGADCTADVNGDGMVDSADLGLILGAWGTADPLFDLNGNGAVDGADIGVLVAQWGPCV